MSLASRSGPSQVCGGITSSSISSGSGAISSGTGGLLGGDGGLGLGELPLLLLLGGRRVVMGAEVGVDHLGVGADVVGRALADDLALAHDDDPVGDVVHDVHVV